MARMPSTVTFEFRVTDKWFRKLTWWRRVLVRVAMGSKLGQIKYDVVQKRVGLEDRVI